MDKRIILTFDLEYWYNTEFLQKYIPENTDCLDDKIVESTLPLLEVLKRHKVNATFFVLGKVAEKYPDLIRQIYKEGHEIASHGYSHKPLSILSPSKFEEEIRKSITILHRITGTRPIGFRAPNFSLDSDNCWALKILEENGFRYDSSIFPLKTPMYGNSGAPPRIYNITDRITEFPLAVYEKGFLRVPVAGGVYFRLTPLRMFTRILKSVQKRSVPVIYFHPHELHNFIPDFKLPWWRRTLKYYNTKNGLSKFEMLLNCKSFQFLSVEDYG